MKEFFRFLFETTPNVPKIDPVEPPIAPEPDMPTPTPNSTPIPKIDPIPAHVSKIDIWCEAIKKMEGAKPSRNNPGNIRFIGQKFAINDKGFCKFDTYAHGYGALRQILVNACSGKSKVYHPTDTLYTFYTKYAPDSDGNNSKNYAQFVAGKLGVSPVIQIKNLL